MSKPAATPVYAALLSNPEPVLRPTMFTIVRTPDEPRDLRPFRAPTLAVVRGGLHP